ncbi:FixH family protein [Paenibacillaceae bacterium WGS1546]|uniref:FixH family protein n=1 Tax=Cohnella sp. WGS1546 TaxID=3366810 RepID=UPI00372D663A
MSKQTAFSAGFVVLLAVAVFAAKDMAGGGESRSGTTAAAGAIRLNVAAERTVAAVMEENAFRLSLTDASGNAIEGAEVEASFVMPGMFCGRIPVEVAETAPGEFRMTGIPVMPGKWSAELDVRVGGQTVRADHAFKAA